MSTSLELMAYHGSISNMVRGNVAFRRLIPQGSGHLRAITQECFQPPLRATWTMFTVADRRSSGGTTSGAERMDGLHVHYAHISNQLNGLIHSVRRDAQAKVSLEYGLQGYSDLTYAPGLPFRLWRHYNFVLDWLPDHVQLRVSNDNDPIEELNIESELPSHAQRSGHLGFRLDNLVVDLAGLTVREL